MFRSKKNPAIRSLIGDGTQVKGDVMFLDGLRVDGEVVGNIGASEESTKTMVVISEQGRVVGQVSAGHVIVNGEVIGPVYASELLELQPKARISGDVSYAALEMHQGAQVKGNLRPVGGADTRPMLQIAGGKG
jgi:cytoskeletal protein CcmA (bactofilin family)